MAVAFEDLQVLQTAETIADGIWRLVGGWDLFARDVVGKQLATAADSVGANIAESYGRYHYGEKLQFLYFARGSLFETKYWLNRASSRGLIKSNEAQAYALQLTSLARQLNNIAATTKSQKQTAVKKLREPVAPYVATVSEAPPDILFTPFDLDYLQST
jgi:four helix bundle protein